MSSTDKYMLAGTIVYLAIGFINMCVFAWQLRRADPERFHWSHWGVVLVPTFWLLWPFFLIELLTDRCEHWWAAITHPDVTGAYTARCFFCGREREARR